LLTPGHQPAGAGRVAAPARQSLFREVNDRVRRTTGEAGPESTWEFFCECAGLCGETAALPLREYDRIRRKRRRLLVLPGHEDGSAERVVAREDGWLVVERPDGRARPEA
jgi:hypothetical protein